MILRLSLLTALVAVVGCNSGGSSGTADLDGIEEAGPLDQFSYGAGFKTGERFLADDSSFSYNSFLEGFEDGVAGDSSRIAYINGFQLGLELSQDTLQTVNRDYLLAGVRSALNGDDIRITDAQLESAQAAFGDSLQVRELRAQAATDPLARERLTAIQRNAVSADSFMTAVSRRPGIQRVGEGVLYTVTEPGEGASPNLGDQVAVRYEGKFINGETFDASGEEPTVLSTSQVVPGFRDALLTMKPGESRTLYLPPSQAYGLLGQQGPGGQGGIPPNSPLVFEVTLVEVVGAAPQQLPPGMFPPQ